MRGYTVKQIRSGVGVSCLSCPQRRTKYLLLRLHPWSFWVETGGEEGSRTWVGRHAEVLDTRPAEPVVESTWVEKVLVQDLRLLPPHPAVSEPVGPAEDLDVSLFADTFRREDTEVGDVREGVVKWSLDPPLSLPGFGSLVTHLLPPPLVCRKVSSVWTLRLLVVFKCYLCVTLGRPSL